ncbi:hypothetical protein [Bradyrhizobium sp. USDA 4486]
MNGVGGEDAVTQMRIGFFKQLVSDLKKLDIIGPTVGSPGERNSPKGCAPIWI